MVRDGDETTVAEFQRRRRACSGGAINRIQNARSVFPSLWRVSSAHRQREREREKEAERNGAITTKTLVFRACVPFRGCVRELRHAVLFRKKREEIFVRLFVFFLLRVKIFLLDALLATHAHFVFLPMRRFEPAHALGVEDMRYARIQARAVFHLPR